MILVPVMAIMRKDDVRPEGLQALAKCLDAIEVARKITLLKLL